MTVQISNDPLGQEPTEWAYHFDHDSGYVSDHDSRNGHQRSRSSWRCRTWMQLEDQGQQAHQL